MAERPQSCDGDYCLIFNNENFTTSSDLSPRPGSSKDAADLERIFSERNFTVDVQNDKTAQEILHHLGEFHKQGNYNRLFVFFLTHGFCDNIYGKDRSISIQNIIDLLSEVNCPSLAGKPKVLVFQSCRLSGGNPSQLCLPIDFFLSFATQPGCETYRDSIDGSFYIQCLIRVINEEGEEKDWSGILMAVNNLMTKRYGVHYNPPDTRCTLRERLPLYLKKRRTSQMITTGTSVSSNHNGEEMVTPSSSSIDLSKPVVTPRDCNIWPRLCQKQFKNQREADKDPHATYIERPYETSINKEAHYLVTKPPPITNADIPAHRLCLMVTNHSMVTTNALPLNTILKQYGYTTLELSNITVDMLICVIQSTKQCKLESFLLIYVGQGPSCKCYDSLHNEINIHQIIDQLSDQVHVNRVFFFETIIIPSFPSSFSDTTHCLSVNTGSLLEYLHSMHSSSLSPQLTNLPRQHTCRLPHSNSHWYSLVREDSQTEGRSYHCTVSMLGQEEFFKLHFITHILSQLGVHIISHKQDIITSSPSLLSAIPLALNTLHITTAIIGEQIPMTNTHSLLLHNAICLERHLLELVKGLLINLNRYSHGEIDKRLRKCEKFFTTDFHLIIVSCLKDTKHPNKVEPFIKQIGKWEKKLLKTIRKTEGFFIPYSKVPEDNPKDKDEGNHYPCYCSDDIKSIVEERGLEEEREEGETLLNNTNIIEEEREREESLLDDINMIEEETGNNEASIEETRERPQLRHEDIVEVTNEHVHTVQQLHNLTNDSQTTMVQSTARPTSNHGNDTLANNNIINYEWVIIAIDDIIANEWVMVDLNININEPVVEEELIVFGDEDDNEMGHVYIRNIEEGWMEIIVGDY